MAARKTWTKATSNQAIGRNLIAHGAAGIIVAYVAPAGQPYSLIANYLMRRRVALSDEPQPSFKMPPVMIVGQEGAEKLFNGSSLTLAQAMQKAESGEFASQALNKSATLAARLKLDEGTGSNVVGLLEGTEVYGPVKRVVGFGAEYSDLGRVFEEVATATGNTVTPDPFPEEKVFYRSDHYSFVQKGVPALMMLGGPGGDITPFLVRAKKWMETDYHQPTDTVRPDWNWDGPRNLAAVGLVIGMRVANAEAMPAWLPSAPFKRSVGAS